MEQNQSKDMEYVHALRAHELATVFDMVGFDGKKVLELGDGFLANRLAEIAEVTAIDVPGSPYAASRLFPVTEYDGKHIPYPDGSSISYFPPTSLSTFRTSSPSNPKSGAF